MSIISIKPKISFLSYLENITLYKIYFTLKLLKYGFVDDNSYLKTLNIARSNCQGLKDERRTPREIEIWLKL